MPGDVRIVRAALELRRPGLEAGDQPGGARILWVPASGLTQVGDQIVGELLGVVGVEVDGSRWSGEVAPGDIAVEPAQVGRIAGQCRPERVPSQQVPCRGMHPDRYITQSGQQALHAGRDVL